MAGELEDQDHGSTFEQQWDDWGPAHIYMSRKSGTPREVETTWLQILAFLTVSWAFLGALGTALTIAFTGTLWGALWLLPCAWFALATVRQLIVVGRMVDSDDGKH